MIYPTDTIYGIGCNALNSESVKKIREIKHRQEKPFSVIAPSKKWIREKCLIDSRAEKWLDKLPGAYTLILKLLDRKAISEEVILGSKSLGARLSDNWFSEIVGGVGVPFVTTSVNLVGERPTSSVRDIGKEILDRVDYIIDVGRIEGRASTVVNLLSGKEVIKER